MDFLKKLGTNANEPSVSDTLPQLLMAMLIVLLGVLVATQIQGWLP